MHIYTHLTCPTQVILDKNTRNKRKCVTTVFGLDSFSVKLSEAAKLFGKKFASGAAVVKSPTEKEQIDIQGDCLEKVCLLVQLRASRLMWHGRTPQPPQNHIECIN